MAVAAHRSHQHNGVHPHPVQHRADAGGLRANLEGIIITDPQLTIQFVNPAFTQLTGYQPEEVIGRTPAILSSGRHDSEFYREMWETLSSTGRWRGEVWNRRKGGELYLELLTVTAIRDEDGNVTHYAGLFTDITQHRLNEERIRQLAYYDALTGLPNRRLLEDRLQHAIRHAHRKQQMLAVMFVDLDHFKAVNYSHGHAAGDHLLTEIAGRLQSCLREEERADEAMYQAKAAGRNQFRLTGLETDDNQAERMAENLPHA